MTASPTEKLRLLSQIILTEENPSALRAACHELYDFFCELAGLDTSAGGEIQSHTILPTGRAISPAAAARCLWDFKRTCEFMRAVRAAIEELKTRIAPEKIEILYAGCGPFAPLIVPVIERFSPAGINLTLLDYHAASLASVGRIFERLDLGEFDPVLIEADAAHYRHPRPLHLVVCETMQTGLTDETQVANCLNLAPQLAESGIFLPGKVSVELCLRTGLNALGTGERIDLGTIFELDAEKIRRRAAFEFPPLRIKIPAHAKSEKLRFKILTRVEIFESFRLNEYDSAVTYPKPFNVAVEGQNADSIELTYVIDQKPRFEYEIY